MELKLNRNGIKTEQKKKWKKGKEWKQKEVEADSKLMNSWEKGNSPKLSKAAWTRKYNCRKTTLHERLSKGESTSNLMQSSYKIREEKEQSAFTTTLT